MIAGLPEEIFGHIEVNDAEIEMIELIVEHPWGATFCPPHAHSWFELNYIFEGTMKTGFDGPMLDVGPGEFFLIPPGLEHAHEYVPDAPHRGVCLRWTVNPLPCADKRAATGIFGPLDGLKHWKPGCYPDRYGLGELLRQLLGQIQERRAPVVIQLAFVSFLLSLASVHEPQGRIAESAASAKTTFLRKVEIYLNDERPQKMSVRQLAASLHMSYHHLARKYKRLTGKTVTGRLTEIRLQRAAELLLQTDEPVSVIAEKTGFATVYYFSRVFKKIHGSSPREYRKFARGRSPGSPSDDRA